MFSTIVVSSPSMGDGVSNGKGIENGVRLAIEEAHNQHFKPGGQAIRFEPDPVHDQGEPHIGL